MLLLLLLLTSADEVPAESVPEVVEHAVPVFLGGGREREREREIGGIFRLPSLGGGGG